MTEQQALENFGQVVLNTEHYQIRAVERKDGLHIYSFRIEGDKVLIPYGFVRGHNSMYHERPRQ